MERHGPFATMMSAGGAASLSEMITLPFDTIKVRMQLFTSQSSFSVRPGVFATVRGVVQLEGVGALWKGLTAGLHRQMCYGTMRLTLYPRIRDRISSSSERDDPPIGKRIIAACSAGALAMAISNPTDVAKVKLQGMRGPTMCGKTRGPSDIQRLPPGQFGMYRHIARHEGWWRLWTGVGPNMFRNGVMTAAELATYDQLKSTLLKCDRIVGVLGNEKSTPLHITCAVSAGFVATVIGSPVDVITTRLQNAVPGVYSGALDCVVKTVKANGVARGLYQGFTANFLRIGSFNVVMFVSFERFLHTIPSVTEFLVPTD